MTMIKVMIKGSLLSRVRIVSDFQSKSSQFFAKNRRLGPKTGYMPSLIFVTPKGHILAWFRVFWVITRQNRSKGLTCGLFPEKKV